MHGLDHFDEELRRRARDENFPLPEGYVRRVQETCAQVEKQSSARHRRVRWPGRMAWAAAALALFIAGPNVAPTAAAAMARVPVLGAVVEIVTFRNYAEDDGRHDLSVTTPVLSGDKAAEQVDRQIQEDTERLMEAFREDCEAAGFSRQSLTVTSQVVTNTPDWFTLRVNGEELRAGGYEFSRFYHIDKTTDTVAHLEDLFPAGTDYISVLSEEVHRQMEAAQSQGEALFPETFRSIQPDQGFYFDESGQLVLVFDEYDLGAGSAGMPEFSIPGEIVAQLQNG